MKHIKTFEELNWWEKGNPIEDIGDIAPDINLSENEEEKLVQKMDSPEYMDMLLKGGHISQSEYSFWAMENGYWD
jgi:hypothetical protein